MQSDFTLEERVNLCKMAIIKAKEKVKDLYPPSTEKHLINKKYVDLHIIIIVIMWVNQKEGLTFNGPSIPSIIELNCSVSITAKQRVNEEVRLLFWIVCSTVLVLHIV